MNKIVSNSTKGSGQITAEEIHASEREIKKFRKDSLSSDVKRTQVCMCTNPRLGKKYFGVEECMNCSKPTKDLTEFKA